MSHSFTYKPFCRLLSDFKVDVFSVLMCCKIFFLFPLDSNHNHDNWFYSLLFTFWPIYNMFCCINPANSCVLCCAGVGPEAEQTDLQYARPWGLSNWTQPELWGIIPSLKLHGQHRWEVCVYLEYKNGLFSAHNTKYSMAESLIWPLSLCSAYLGCSTICTKGEMCEDFPGQRSQLWKGNINNYLTQYVVYLNLQHWYFFPLLILQRS